MYVLQMFTGLMNDNVWQKMTVNERVTTTI